MRLIGFVLAVYTVFWLALTGPDRGLATRFPAGALLLRMGAAVAAMVLLTSGCAGKGTKPDIPRGIIVQPKVVEVVRKEYVNVPPQFTDQLPIAEGPLSQCPVVAAERKKALKKANADRAAVRALSGTEAKP